MPLSPGTSLGPYEIVSALGAGGMGEVFKARDTRLGRTVAVKILPEQAASDPDRQRRFESEARAVAALNHPEHLHAARHWLDKLAAGGRRTAVVHFLVMEYLEGQSLAQRLRKGPLPLEQVLELGAQIADALAAAHRRGIVHRDLKPANVMLVKSGRRAAGEAARLRPGEAEAAAGCCRCGHVGAPYAGTGDLAGPDHGNRSLHGARAARGTRERRPDGHLRVRLPAVRDAAAAAGRSRARPRRASSPRSCPASRRPCPPSSPSRRPRSTASSASA